MSEFEATIAEVKTLMAITPEEFEKYTAELLALFHKTSQNHSEPHAAAYASALYNVLSAGVPETAALMYIEAGAHAVCNGAVSNIETAVNVLLAVFNPCAMDASTASQFADIVWASLANRSIGPLGQVKLFGDDDVFLERCAEKEA